MKPGIREFHRFIKCDFREQLLSKYKKLRILTEADLQAYASELLRAFLRRNESPQRRFRVLNKHFLREIGIHPDIGIFKRERPWMLFEIKERRTLPVKIARMERERLLLARKKLGTPPKRGYLLYAIRFGNKRVLGGPKGEGKRYFFEIPIVLQRVWPIARIRRWEWERKTWSKYTSKKKVT